MNQSYESPSLFYISISYQLHQLLLTVAIIQLYGNVINGADFPQLNYKLTLSMSSMNANPMGINTGKLSNANIS